MSDAIAVAWLLSAVVMVGGLLMVSALLFTGRVRCDNNGGMIGGGALALAALFVWLRPEVRSPLDSAGVAPQAMSGLAALGLAGVLLTSRRARALAEYLFEQSSSRAVAVVTVCVVLLAVPPALLPVARHWDVSGWMDSHSYDVFALNIASGKIPAGNSAYMPVYQYGMALVYYTVGHFFFAQQLVNVGLALTGVGAVCLATWVLFRSAGAALIAGVLAVNTKPLFYAVQITQIETWYTPIVCVLLLAWAAYWRRPLAGRGIALALMIGLAVNTRNQGALFFAFMAATPVFVASLNWRAKVRHVALIASVVAVCLVPWTIRNYVVDGRVSPFGSRSAMYVGILSDPRIGLYGIRYWEGWEQVAAEYAARFPNPAEREQAYLSAAWTNLTQDPLRTSKAMLWRAGAFYGLLPDGWLDPAQARPSEWRTEWRRYVYWRTVPLFLLPLSVLALIVRADATVFALAGAVLANLAIIVVSGSAEDRISYPVLPLHILMIAALFSGPVSPDESDQAARAQRATAMRWLWPIAAALASLVVCRVVLGARFIQRPLIEPSMTLQSDVPVDPAVPLFTIDQIRRVGVGEPGLRVGDRVRLRCMVSNYMFPPKYAGRVSEVPAFASDPADAVFFFAYPLAAGALPALGGTIGVSYRGALRNDVLREGEAAEIEGRIVSGASAGDTSLWLRADRVWRLPVAASQMPAFP